MELKDFKQYFIIEASPSDVYNAMVNPNLIELWTNDDVVMEEKPDTEFSLYGGYIVGKNLEFEKNKKIVQEWYFDDQENKSIVTIKLHPDKKGTSVEIRQTNIPAEAYENITSGWADAYIGGIAELIED